MNLTRNNVIIFLIIVAALSALGIYLYMQGDFKIFVPVDNNFTNLGTSADLSTPHSNAIHNQVLMSRAGLEPMVRGVDIMYRARGLSRPAYVGPHGVEFKVATTEPGADAPNLSKPAGVHKSRPGMVVAPQARPLPDGPVPPIPSGPLPPGPSPVPVVPDIPTIDPYGDSDIYGKWQDPMGGFIQNVGAFKTKRLKGLDFENVLVGVPGANNVQVEERLDKMFFPYSDKVTPEDRLKMITEAPPADPLSHASRVETGTAPFRNQVYNVPLIANRVPVN